jgi:hypothetical protein
MDKWKILNQHRSLVNEGKALPVPCPDCKNPVVFMIDKDDDPMMWCPWGDDITLRPGLQFWDDMQSIIKEHYV